MYRTGNEMDNMDILENGYVDIPNIKVLTSTTGIFTETLVTRPFNVAAFQVLSLSYNGAPLPTPLGASVILVQSDIITSWTNSNFSTFNGAPSNLVATFPIQTTQPIYNAPGPFYQIPSIFVKTQNWNFVVSTDVGNFTPLAQAMALTICIWVRVPKNKNTF
jgi:hypothetical protein